KLTIKALDRMRPGDVLRDVAIGGFFAERGKRPRVSLKIQADLPDGRTVKMTLGQHPGSSLEDVRAEALRLLTEIKAGRARHAGDLDCLGGVHPLPGRPR